MEYARGFVLKASANGNSTTNAFYYSGDGYLFFQPKSSEEGAYGISVYDDETTQIVKANVLVQFGGVPEQQFTRLRLPPGNYYLEITSTIPWEAWIVNERGVEWLKRTIHRQQVEGE